MVNEKMENNQCATYLTDLYFSEEIESHELRLLKEISNDWKRRGEGEVSKTTAMFRTLIQ